MNSKLKNLKSVKILKRLKNYKGPSRISELNNDKLFQEYKLILLKYMNMCKNYKNNNKNIEEFINNFLYRTSSSRCINEWRICYYTKPLVDYKIEYPKYNMFSLTDDKTDFVLDSPYQTTIERNQKTLNDSNSDLITKIFKKLTKNN